MLRSSIQFFRITAVLVGSHLSAGSALSQQPVTKEIERESLAIEFQPVPDWVDEVPLDLETKIEFLEKESREGFVFRLTDLQRNAETDELFFRYADEFVTIAGIHDHGEVVIEYDPAYETLQVHRITIHRAGQKMDGLKHAFVREVSAEDELSEGMLYGHRKLIIYPSGIQPGDVLEYAFTIKGTNPYYAGEFFDEIIFSGETRVLKSCYRLVKSKSREVFTKNHQTDIQPEKRDLESVDGMEECIWIAEKIPAVFGEPGKPEWFNQQRYVELSAFDSWGKVAELGRKHYEFAQNERNGSELEKIVASFRAAHSDEKNQVTAAIRFVQDEIRYLGIEEGARAFIPAHPELTLERRYGDCKDKTALLQALLERLGVSSSPVYVDMDEGRDLKQRLPSPLAFDHVVLNIQMASGANVFCDCTQSYMGGIAGESLAFPSYYFGLDLFSEDAELEELPTADLESNRRESRINLQVGDINQPVSMTVTTKLQGRAANASRYYLETDSAALTQLERLNYIQADYGKLTSLSAPQFSDVRDANRIEIDESYQIESPWSEDLSDPGWFSLTIHLRDIRDLLIAPLQPVRQTPFAISHPQNFHQEINVHLSDPETWEFENELHFIEGPAFTFRREVKFDQTAGVLQIVADFKSLTDHILPEELERHTTAVESAYELVRYEIWALDEENDSVETHDKSSSETESGLNSDSSLVVGMLGGAAAVGVLWLLVHMRRRQSPTGQG